MNIKLQTNKTKLKINVKIKLKNKKHIKKMFVFSNVSSFSSSFFFFFFFFLLLLLFSSSSSSVISCVVCLLIVQGEVDDGVDDRLVVRLFVFDGVAVAGQRGGRLDAGAARARRRLELDGQLLGRRGRRRRLLSVVDAAAARAHAHAELGARVVELERRR